MGGVKRKATVVLKKESKYKIPLRFDCPLCDAKNSIGVKLFRSSGSARVYCRGCQAGQGKEYTFLPLEKAVDVFFRFREDLVEHDRQFLAQKHIETNAVPVMTALQQLAEGTTVASVAPDGRQAGGAAPRGIDIGDEDDGAGVGETYTPYIGVTASLAHGDYGDEDGGSRAVDAVLGRDMDDLLGDDDEDDRKYHGRDNAHSYVF